jgi:hypothetical protein
MGAWVDECMHAWMSGCMDGVDGEHGWKHGYILKVVGWWGWMND